MSWTQLTQKLSANWRPGEHVTLIGPTESGKTHMAVSLLEMCRYRLVLATKRKDPLVSQLQQDGYKITGDLRDIQWDAEKRVPIHKKIVYWPTFPESMNVTDRLKAQAALMQKALDWADKTGGWAVLIDETMWMHDVLRLEKALSSAWFQGRSQGLSIIACAQRPSRVPRLAFSQARYLFIWQTADGRDVDNLQEISSGIPKEMVESAVRTLDFQKHEALFIDARRKELARVVAPPR